MSKLKTGCPKWHLDTLLAPHFSIRDIRLVNVQSISSHHVPCNACTITVTGSAPGAWYCLVRSRAAQLLLWSCTCNCSCIMVWIFVVVAFLGHFPFSFFSFFFATSQSKLIFCHIIIIGICMVEYYKFYFETYPGRLFCFNDHWDMPDG